MVMQVIFGNYGDGTIALIQWAHEQGISDLQLVRVETGFAAQHPVWEKQVRQGQDLALSYGFSVQTLQAKPNFSELVLEKQAFPSPEFQWCAAWLKGLPFLAWLDEKDPACEAVILFTHRSSKALDLKSKEQYSEHFGGRGLCYPLCEYPDDEFYALIQRAGFVALGHRSWECAPCVHSTAADLRVLSAADQSKVADLEAALGQNFFAKEAISGAQGIKAMVEWTTVQPKTERAYSLGCGNPFGCGE